MFKPLVLNIPVVLVFFLFFPFFAYSQKNYNDSCLSAHIITASFSLQAPGKDMAKRFGNNLAVNGSYYIKLRSNWILGADFSYIFSNEVKNEQEILEPILTSDGNIINSNGLNSDFSLQERGFYASVRIGKIIPLSSHHPNSGIMIMAGTGILQHKIRINDSENNTPQISGDYKKGYDMLSNGLGINEFIGYLHMSNNRLLNFYAGFEFIQAWTVSRRDYNFTLRAKDDRERNDYLSGLRFGWIFPIYGKERGDIFYY